MRIGAVSQHHSLQWVTLGGRSILLSKVATDRIVVLGGHLERLERKTVTQRLTHVAVFPSIQERVVVRRIGQHTYSLVVLGRRSEKGDTSDIDLLDGVRERAARFRDGGRKGIEVADDDVDLGDGLVCEVALVRRERTRENTSQSCISVSSADRRRKRLPPWTAG